MADYVLWSNDKQLWLTKDGGTTDSLLKAHVFDVKYAQAIVREGYTPGMPPKTLLIDIADLHFLDERKFVIRWEGIHHPGTEVIYAKNMEIALGQFRRDNDNKIRSITEE